MLPAKLEKVLLWIIYVCSGFILLVLPLLVVNSTPFPALFPKAICFQILIEICAGAWLILLLDKKYRPNWKNQILKSQTIFLVVLIVTALAGIDPERSFFSTYERMTGIVAFIHVWLWFLILQTTVKNKSVWRIFIGLSLISTLCVDLSTIWGWLNYNVRLGTFSNTNYLAVFLLINFFLGLYLQKSGSITNSNVADKWIKRLLNVFLVLTVFTIILIASRGGFLALVVSLLIYGIYSAVSLPSRTQRKTWLGLIISVSLLASLSYGVLNFTQFGARFLNNIPVAAKRVIYHPFQDKNRSEMWKMAWLGFKDHPVLGWGLENFNESL